MGWLLDCELIASIYLLTTSAIKASSVLVLIWRTFGLALGFKDFPESESLISCCTCYSGTVRAQSKMKDAAGMPSKLSNLSYFWIFPDAKLVINVAMWGKNFFLIGVPLKGTHLTVCGDWVYVLADISVPELDWFVTATTTGSKKVPLPRTPSKSLHGCFVVSEDYTRTIDGHILKGISVLWEGSVTL